jgi:hypothetical protein
LKISNEKPIKIVNNYPKNRESKNRLYLVLISYQKFNGIIFFILIHT